MKLKKHERNEVYKKVQISSEEPSSKGRQGDRAGPINLLTPMEGKTDCSQRE